MVPCFWRLACAGQGHHDCWDRGAVATLADLACPFAWQQRRGPVACRAPHFACLVIAQHLPNRSESE
eukprot:1573975-Pleurochrysis_carterae.AAC.1